MIEAFSLRTAHHFQDALSSQARLRFEVFVSQRGLQHDSFEGLEFDEFDTPSAIYLVWRDKERVVRGTARMLRTTRPYMLQSHWPFLVKGGEPPVASDLFEVTRVCVDRSLRPDIRRKVFPELLCGIRQILSLLDGKGMIGVTREHLLSHFIRSGIQWLGDPAKIEGEIERAFFVPTALITPVHHCSLYGIDPAVLANPNDFALRQSVA